MYPTLLFGALMIAGAARYAVRPERRLVPLMVTLALMTLSSGGLGFVTGVIKSFDAMGGVVPDKRWIWMLGVGEALHDVALAFALVLLAAITAAVGAFRLARGAQESLA